MPSSPVGLVGSLVVALAVVVVIGAGGADPGLALGAAQCQGTRPNHAVRLDAGFGRDGFNYGNARLRAHLNWKDGRLRAGILPDGGSVATINEDGSMWAKQGWWRGLRGVLGVTGRRLDAPAPPLRADIRGGYGAQGFIPVGLTFPTVGCWRVTGKLGNARLTYVVRVTKLPS
jgi:hypothetical protein